MSERLLHGRRALVTGSVQGIGLAIAQELARQGCAICDPVAHNMTGTAMPVDGGWTAQ